MHTAGTISTVVETQRASGINGIAVIAAAASKPPWQRIIVQLHGQVAVNGGGIVLEAEGMPQIERGTGRVTVLVGDGCNQLYQIG